MRALLVFSCVLSLCTGALAQTEAQTEALTVGGEVSLPAPQETRLGDKPQSGFLFEAPVEVRYQKRTDLVISTVDITGTVKGPSLGVVRSGRRPGRRPLIALRPDFRPELLASPSSL
jgi:hypothetical protein